MINKEFFYYNVRRILFDGKITTSQFNGLNAILEEWEKNFSQYDDRFLAYMFATVHHETDKKMQPIEEYGKGRSKPYGSRIKMCRKPYTDTNEIFYGRGFVQLTWYENYDLAGKKLKKDFLHHANDVMKLDNATKILFMGMIEGWFTSKKLGDYFSKTKNDWVSARRIINGLDKASLISSYAKLYYSCISHTD